MKVYVRDLRPRRDKSLIGVVTVELLDVGLVIRNVGIHQGRDGRLWTALPSKPVHDLDGKRRVPCVFFRNGWLAEFEYAVFEQVKRQGLFDGNSCNRNDSRPHDKGGL
jgi:hypothetical protein